MVNWEDIDTVLLDMDGTLLDLHFDNHFWQHHLPKRYAHIHQKDEQFSREHIHKLTQRIHGTLDWYCLDYWTQQLNLDIPALKREIQHMISIRPYVVEFLKQLKDNGKHIILVTNAHRQSLQIKMDTTGLARLFDEIVVSHDFQAAKEQPEFWRQMQISHPFNPDKTLLIDDTASVLQSAHQFGIRYLLTLLQPDSQKPVRKLTEFPGILHFDEIMPAGKKSDRAPGGVQ